MVPYIPEFAWSRDSSVKRAFPKTSAPVQITYVNKPRPSYHFNYKTTSSQLPFHEWLLWLHSTKPLATARSYTWGFRGPCRLLLRGLLDVLTFILQGRINVTHWFQGWQGACNQCVWLQAPSVNSTLERQCRFKQICTYAKVLVSLQFIFNMSKFWIFWEFWVFILHFIMEYFTFWCTVFMYNGFQSSFTAVSMINL